MIFFFRVFLSLSTDHRVALGMTEGPHHACIWTHMYRQCDLNFPNTTNVFHLEENSSNNKLDSSSYYIIPVPNSLSQYLISANYFQHRVMLLTVTDCITPTTQDKQILTFCHICFRSLSFRIKRLQIQLKPCSSHKYTEHPLLLHRPHLIDRHQPPNPELADNTPVCLDTSPYHNVSINHRLW